MVFDRQKDGSPAHHAPANAQIPGVEVTTCDEVSFTRSGVTGTLLVTKDAFTLDAKLGFLLGAFKDRIESEIVKNLDALLAGKPDKSAAKGTAAKAPAKAAVKTAAKKAPATKKS